MTESTRTSKLLSRLRQMHPLWEVWKVNDRVGKGRPDVQVQHSCGKVFFFEFKRGNTTTNPWNKLTAIQQRTCSRLHEAGHNVFLVMLHENNTHTIYTLRGLKVLGPSKDAFIAFFEGLPC